MQRFLLIAGVAFVFGLCVFAQNDGPYPLLPILFLISPSKVRSINFIWES